MRFYILIAVSVLGLVLVCCVFWYRSEAIDARGQLQHVISERDQALIENHRQASVIQRLNDWDKKKDVLFADISKQLSIIHDDVMQTGESLRELETTNEDIRIFLNTALPADLQRVLNRK